MKQIFKVLFLSLALFYSGCVGVAINGTNYLIDSGELDFGGDEVGTTKAAVVDICQAMARDENKAESMYEGRGLKVNGRLIKPSNIYEEYLGSHYVLRVRGASIHFVPTNDEAKGLQNGQLLSIQGIMRSLDFNKGLCSISLKKTQILKAYPLSFKPRKTPVNSDWHKAKIIENESSKKVIIDLPKD